MKELKRKNVQSGIIEAVATTCFSVKEKKWDLRKVMRVLGTLFASYLYEKRFELKLFGALGASCWNVCLLIVSFHAGSYLVCF